MSQAIIVECSPNFGQLSRLVTYRELYTLSNWRNVCWLLSCGFFGTTMWLFLNMEDYAIIILAAAQFVTNTHTHTHLWQFAQTFWSKGRVFHTTFCAIAVAMTWEDLQQVSWQQLVVFAYFPASFFVNQYSHIVRATTIGWGWWFPMKSTIQKNLYQQIYGDLRRVIWTCSKSKLRTESYSEFIIEKNTCTSWSCGNRHTTRPQTSSLG